MTREEAAEIAQATATKTRRQIFTHQILTDTGLDWVVSANRSMTGAMRTLAFIPGDKLPNNYQRAPNRQKGRHRVNKGRYR